MSDPRPAPSNRDEAAAWFARLGNLSITTQSLRDFREWRQDPANDAAYQEIESVWSTTGALANDPDVLRATEAALARKAPLDLLGWIKGPWMGWTLALATVALSAIGLAVVNAKAPTYATAVGEQRLVRLADGSRIHLNTDSRVKVEFRRGERRLALLRGEAMFDVAHDASRPFIVDAGDARVRALGTKFDVRRDTSAVRVTLLQGSVRVSHDDRPQAWLLAPNQQLTLTKAGAAATRATNAAESTSWTTGRLVFHQTPLRAAVAEVNRYADQKVELEPAGLGDHLVNGVFDVGDTDSFVRGVSALFDLRATSTDGAIRLRPEGPPSAG